MGYCEKNCTFFYTKLAIGRAFGNSNYRSSKKYLL
ncbi:hypothetical protein ACUW6V_000669 [Cronobacter sp. 153480017-3]